jgi:membrane-associated protease RseP (regulator of RpoE activity)
VEVSDASSTLRTQLKLPKDEGIVIDRVLPDSPAQKAGFQEHDVLVAVNGKPLAKSEDLSAAVKASEGKALKFSVLRGGQKMEIDVTPEKRTADAYRVRTRLASQDLLMSNARLTTLRQGQRAVLSEWVARQHQPGGDTTAQIERMLKQIDELRDSVKALQGTVAKQQPVLPPKPAPAKTDLPGQTDQPKK